MVLGLRREMQPGDITHALPAVVVIMENKDPAG
jgi:hypothetical protein